MRLKISLILFILLSFCISSASFSDEKKNHSEEIKKLKKEIEALKTRVAELEKLISPMKERLIVAGRQSAHRKKFNECISIDKEKYTQQEFQEIEELYQIANKKWNSEEAKKSLLELIKKYPESNRAGCAILYLGQWTEGKKKKDYLNKAIQNYSDCFYGDGVQVGAFARFLLGNHYEETGDKHKAKKYFYEIKQKYPTAIDHSGKLLVELILWQ